MVAWCGRCKRCKLHEHWAYVSEYKWFGSSTPASWFSEIKKKEERLFPNIQATHTKTTGKDCSVRLAITLKKWRLLVLAFDEYLLFIVPS